HIRLIGAVADATWAPPAPVTEATGAIRSLYQELGRQLGVRLVVDSSKYPAEAAALLGRRDLDVRVLHMVRDPRATAFSYQRGKSYVAEMDPVRSTGYWSAINAASDLIGIGAGDRYLRVRHEDFARRPQHVLGEVMRFAGLTEPNPLDGEGRVTLGDNHTVTGNPDRLNRGQVTISASDRWRTELDFWPRACAVAGGGLQMYRYGYAGIR
ncbi:sulfotransferase, partial [Streptomyces spectabilis]